jgi:hypothetical protein
MDADRLILEHLEPALREASADEAAVMIALIAREAVGIAPPELSAAVRRALLVLAAGGDLRRELLLDDPAVTGLASDVDAPERRGELEAALRALRSHASDLPAAAAAVDALLADSARAWQALACAILADELADDD